MMQTSAALNRRLPGMARFVAIAVLAVLAAYSLFSYWQLRVIAGYHTAGRKAVAALGAADRTLIALQNAETGQRGYLLTGQEKYLAPYNLAVADVDSSRRDLREALEGEPEQLALLDRLDVSIDKKLAELSETLQSAQTEGFDAARQIVLEHRGLEAMNDIRTSLAEIRDAAHARRDAVRVDSDVSIRNALAALIISTIFSATIIVIGFYVMRREFAARERLTEALKSTDRNKNDFIALLGHELRNPLAAIRNATEVLDMVKDLPELADEMRAIIERQTGVMTRLVDDLLDVSRVAHGKIELKKTRCDLCALVERTTADICSASHGAGVKVTVDHPRQPIWIEADETRLAQALGNLLYNAIKFSGRGGQVLVSLRNRNSSRRAVLSVQDQGIGMDRDTLRQIFEPFAQGRSNGDRSRGGLGLGLPLTKGLIELHGGKLVAHSDGLGRGSVFSAVLPVLDAGAPLPANEPHVEQPISRCRVVVIDDRRDSSYPLQRMLEQTGHEVHVAQDGSTGLALAREVDPDLVLCDIGLPGELNGYDVARALRSDPDGANYYLVALTAYGDEEARKAAHAAGFDRHVVKPASMADLNEIIASLPCDRRENTSSIGS